MTEKNNDKILEPKEQITELKEAVKLTHPTAIKLLSGDVRNIEKVLRDHLNSHIKVAREQLTEKDKLIIFKEFDDAIMKQLKKLGAKEGNSINRICSFYQMGDSEGQCGLYGSNDITKSMFCKDISCEYKNDGENRFKEESQTVLQSGEHTSGPSGDRKENNEKTSHDSTDSTPSKLVRSKQEAHKILRDVGLGGFLEKEPTDAEYGLSEEGLETIKKIIDEYLEKKELIAVEKPDLRKMIEQGKKTCNRYKDLWWSNMEEKYRGMKKIKTKKRNKTNAL